MRILILFLFFSTTSAIIFDCDFRDGTYTYLPLTYFCFVYSFSEGQNQFLTAINGNHESGKTNDDVKGINLFLRDKNLNFFPQNIENIFPNIIAINIGYVIKVYKGDEFDNFINLEWAALYDGEIEHVPGNLFSKNPKMRAIFLDGNKIKTIGSNFMNGLNELMSVCLLKNICTQEWAESASDVQKLKQTLKSKCFIEETTTQAPTTTTTEPLTTTTTTQTPTTNPFESKLNELVDKLSKNFENLEKNFKTFINSEVSKLNNEINEKFNAKLSKIEENISTLSSKLDKKSEHCQKSTLETFEKLDENLGGKIEKFCKHEELTSAK
jgi:hypothetical protein